jgi:hypothetical protein
MEKLCFANKKFTYFKNIMYVGNNVGPCEKMFICFGKNVHVGLLFYFLKKCSCASENFKYGKFYSNVSRLFIL